MPTNKLSKTLGVAFIGASIIQVTNKELFIGLVPDSIGEHRAAPLQAGMTAGLSAIGACFFSSKTRLLARTGALAILFGSLPAAIDQIRHPETLNKVGLPANLAPVRVAAQLGMIVAVIKATQKN